MGSKKLAIVQSPDLASDAKDALKRLTEPLDNNLVMYLDSNQDLSACNVDYNGNSNCHAVITFNDSPDSGRVNATWNYTIQVDPSKIKGVFNVIDHNGPFEAFWLPLQVAIDNAIANNSDTPEAMSYDFSFQEARDKDAHRNFLMVALYILSFVFFISMAPVVHHLSSMMSSERGSGLSQLTDAMGGGVVWPRIFSYVVFFDLLYLPLWIILGCCKWKLFAPSQDTTQSLTPFSDPVSSPPENKSGNSNILANTHWVGDDERHRIRNCVVQTVRLWYCCCHRSECCLGCYRCRGR